MACERMGLVDSATGPAAPPDAFRYPYEAQSVLSSTQLAAYIHLPQLEAPGFGVLVEPELVFDVEPPKAALGPSIELGRVARLGGSPGTPYAIGTRSLARHAFVTGMTGSGKTNTIVHLLQEAWRGGVRFSSSSRQRRSTGRCSPIPRSAHHSASLRSATNRSLHSD